MKLKIDMVLPNVPGETGMLWNNLGVYENILAGWLLELPPGTCFALERDAWELRDDGAELILTHGTLVDGKLIDESSRFDISLDWVDVTDDDLRGYLELLKEAISKFCTKRLN